MAVVGAGLEEARKGRQVRWGGGMGAGRVLLLIAALAGPSGLAACAATSAQPEFQATTMATVPPRVGSVHLLRGFMGISSGTDALKDELARLGLRVAIANPEQWRSVARAIVEERRSQAQTEPIILIGFSAGAGDAIRISQVLAQSGVPVDLLVTLDPSSPLDPLSPRAVPANVRRALNLYETNTVLQGVPVGAGSGFGGELVNVDLSRAPGIGHPEFARHPEVRDRVIAAVLKVAIPRRQPPTPGKRRKPVTEGA